jgi:hypothetical protein
MNSWRLRLIGAEADWSSFPTRPGVNGNPAARLRLQPDARSALRWAGMARCSAAKQRSAGGSIAPAASLSSCPGVGRLRGRSRKPLDHRVLTPRLGLAHSTPTSRPRRLKSSRKGGESVAAIGGEVHTAQATHFA